MVLQQMRRQHLSIALFLACVLCLAAVTQCAKPKQKGLVPGLAGAFKSNGLEEILSYSDFNRDGKIDILTKSATLTLSNQQINIYVWNTNRKEYQLWGSLASDYVALQTVLVSSFKELPYFHLVLYYSSDIGTMIKMVPVSCTNFICEFKSQLEVPQISTGIDAASPSLLGIQGQIGLLFHLNGTANVLLFEMNDTLTYSISPLNSYIENGSAVTKVKYSYNGDYDGDCLTDLIILKQDSNKNSFLQFIRGSETNHFQFIQQIPIRQIVQHFTIQDINFDGKNDLVLLLQNSKLQIHYHKYGSDKKLCNGLASQELPYDFQISETETKYIQRVDFSNPLYPNSLLLFGDFNNDGYEDLSLTFTDSTGALPQAVLLENVGCTGAACGQYNPLLIQESLTLNLRTFTTKTITGINQVTSRLSFVDILDDGNLDFMFHMQVADPSGTKYMTIQAVYNNVDYDAFFLTITILSSRKQSDNLFDNTEYIGGVASFFVTLLSGELAPKTANQLAQVGATLQLPYIRQGLGRTNNYLEDLIITVPRNPYTQFKWSPIIPNSDILIVPPRLDTSQWTLQVMIEPTQKMGFVLLLVIVSLGILGAVILHLSRKQKEQDKETQQSFYTLLR